MRPAVTRPGERAITAGPWGVWQASVPVSLTLNSEILEHSREKDPGISQPDGVPAEEGGLPTDPQPQHPLAGAVAAPQTARASPRLQPAV